MEEGRLVGNIGERKQSDFTLRIFQVYQRFNKKHFFGELSKYKSVIQITGDRKTIATAHGTRKIVMGNLEGHRKTYEDEVGKFTKRALIRHYLETLKHEMCHLYLHKLGERGHNRTFWDLAKQVGALHRDAGTSMYSEANHPENRKREAGFMPKITLQVGQRVMVEVEGHESYDGRVTKIGKKYVYVHLDKIGREWWTRPENVIPNEEVGK